MPRTPATPATPATPVTPVTPITPVTPVTPATRNPLGFSLLEVVVVVLIISVGLGLFLGINYRQKESIQVRAFVSDLSQFLRTARSHALVDGLQNVCIYDSAQGRIQEGLRGKSIQVPQGVRIIVENISEDEQIPLVSFYPDGSLVLEKMVIESEQHKYKAEADRLLGKVQFNELND